ncbi:hypothetical protein CALVIDRAFT_38018 [Calocera viscosa TUFC12733]|uniref:Uncharacterized protein n=1 Tax=Calocera viscosa (strain TUFC12733) TaxID=1330018 RepID=A0A167NZG7_CALVF|nr:hypothetical protein CALVIDRAFT_38018 [Calocera viscosa TUFC12733]
MCRMTATVRAYNLGARGLCGHESVQTSTMHSAGVYYYGKRSCICAIRARCSCIAFRTDLCEATLGDVSGSRWRISPLAHDFHDPQLTQHCDRTLLVVPGTWWCLRTAGCELLQCMLRERRVVSSLFSLGVGQPSNSLCSFGPISLGWCPS